MVTAGYVDVFWPQVSILCRLYAAGGLTFNPGMPMQLRLFLIDRDKVRGVLLVLTGMFEVLNAKRALAFAQF